LIEIAIECAAPAGSGLKPAKRPHNAMTFDLPNFKRWWTGGDSFCCIRASCEKTGTAFSR